MIDLDEIISAVCCDEKLFNYILKNAKKTVRSYGFPHGSQLERNAIDDAIQQALINVKVVDIVQFLVEEKKKEYLRNKKKSKQDDSFQENPEELMNHVQDKLIKTFISPKDPESIINNASQHFIEEEIKFQQSLAKSKSLIEQTHKNQRETFEQYQVPSNRLNNQHFEEDAVNIQDQYRNYENEDLEDSMLPSFSSSEPEDSTANTTRRMLKKLKKNNIPDALNEKNQDIYTSSRYNGDEDFYNEEYPSTLNSIPSLNIDPDFLNTNDLNVLHEDSDSRIYHNNNYQNDDSDESTVQANIDKHHEISHFSNSTGDDNNYDSNFDIIFKNTSEEKDTSGNQYLQYLNTDYNNNNFAGSQTENQFHSESEEEEEEEEEEIEEEEEDEEEDEEEEEEEENKEDKDEINEIDTSKGTNHDDNDQSNDHASNSIAMESSYSSPSKPNLVINTEDDVGEQSENEINNSQSYYEDDFHYQEESPLKPISASSLYYFDSNEFAANLDAEQSGKPRRKVRFDPDPVKDVLEFERIPKNLVPDLFYSHEEETQFSINQSKEYSLALKEDMKWYDWILKMIDMGYDDDQVLAQVDYESDNYCDDSSYSHDNF